MRIHTVTVTHGLTSDTYAVPHDAARPLVRYIRRHQRLPFFVSVAVFMRHWSMGVNLMAMPDPTKR